MRLRKGEELLFWILNKITEIFFFSTTVHQCNIAFSVVRVQVCFKSYLRFYYISFLPARVAASSIKRICAPGWFVGTENSKGSPDTNNYV